MHNCIHCAAKFKRAGGTNFCSDCADLAIKASHRCAALVQAAIRKGILAPLDECYCVDCGAFARIYDHRDYSKPLEVQPVCSSCNQRRGHAKPFSGPIVLAA